MTDDPSQPGPPPRGSNSLQFTLATLLFLALPVSLLAGAYGAMIRSKRGEPAHWFGLLLVAATPMALAISMGLYRSYRRRVKRRTR